MVDQKCGLFENIFRVLFSAIWTNLVEILFSHSLNDRGMMGSDNTYLCLDWHTYLEDARWIKKWGWKTSPTSAKFLSYIQYMCFSFKVMAPNLGFKAQTLIDQGRTTQDNIDKMREWLSTQYYPNFTDEQIAIFLLASDNNHEVCKETLKAYYRVKMEMKDLFVNRNIQKPEMQQQIKTV